MEVNGDEWSFGYCDRGSGGTAAGRGGTRDTRTGRVFPSGVTALSPARVRNILGALQAAWQGHEYDLLARNCNHFCEAFAEMLGVGSLPAWVNRFASQADATVAAVNYASEQTQKFAEDVGNGLSSFGNGILSLFGAGTRPPEDERRTRTASGRTTARTRGGGEAKGSAGRRGEGDGDETASQSTATPSEAAIRQS